MRKIRSAGEVADRTFIIPLLTFNKSFYFVLSCASVFVIAPPDGSVVVAVETQVFTSLADGLAFLAFLSSQATCITS